MPVDDERRTGNIVRALVGLSLVLVSWTIYNDTYSQWLYVRFEKKILGNNFTIANISATTNPCLEGTNTTISPWAAQMDEAQSRSSAFQSWMMLATMLPAVFTNFIMGGFSDRKGRKNLFILPTIGLITKIAVTCAVAHWDLDLNFLFIGFVAEGLCGTLVANFLAISIYMADNTNVDSGRSYGMVVSQAVTNIFLSLSHLGMGFFIQAEGYVWSLSVALMICVVALLWFTVFLRETLPSSDFKDCGERTQALKNVFSFYLVESDNPKNKRKDYIILGLVFFLFGASLGTSFDTMYLMDEPLCWGSRQIGYVTTFKGLVQSLVGLAAMPLLQRVASDEVICVLSLVSGAACRAVLAFSTRDWLVYLAYSLSMLELILMPAIRGILSRMVPFDKQGSLFASIAVVEVTTLVASGVGINQIYSHTVVFWHGFGYIFVSGCTMVAVVLMLAYVILLHKRRSSLVSYVVVEEDPTDSSLLINHTQVNQDEGSDDDLVY